MKCLWNRCSEDFGLRLLDLRRRRRRMMVGECCGEEWVNSKGEEQLGGVE
jgi:hypothetical protein